MILGCIDIGSNTTRLLVADASDGSLRVLVTRRAFTRIGTSLGDRGRIPPEKVEETAEVVRAQAQLAAESGAAETMVVATAAIRNAANRDELSQAVERATGLTLSVLSGEEEARLSFVGAARTLATPAEGTLAVVDVGGGSTEVAIGAPDGQVEWSESFAIGSGFLADSYLHSDPPAAAELEAVRRHVAGTLDSLDAPAAQTAVAVGGTATSLHRLVGATLEHDTFSRAVAELSRTPIARAAKRFELDPERVRLLPAGILVLEGVSRRLRLPLQIARGGLREGMILERVGGGP